MNGAALASHMRHRIGARRPELKRIDRSAGLFGAGVLVCCLAGIAAGSWWIGPRPARSSSSVSVAIDGTAFTLPSSWVHARSRAADGREQAELVVPWAELAGPDPQAGASEQLVFVTLTPADAAFAPSERPANLYARFISASALPSDGGLIRREFRDGTPFEGETLFVAPPDGRAFAARCALAADRDRAGASCLAEFRLGQVDVQVKFPTPLLAHWAALTGSLRRALGTERP